MTRPEFYQLLANRRDQFPGERFGQATFNLIHTWFPTEANRLRATPLDPFYDNRNVEPFLAALGI